MYFSDDNKKRDISTQTETPPTPAGSPLFIAARDNDVGAMIQLISKGANLEFGGMHNDTYLTPLQVAASKKNAAAVAVLLQQGAPVNTADIQGCTALHHACTNGSISHRDTPHIVRALIQNGAAVDVPSHDGTTPLYLAAQTCNKDPFEQACVVLLEKGADPSKANRCNQDALFWAVYYGNAELTQAFLMKHNNIAGQRKAMKRVLSSPPSDNTKKILFEHAHPDAFNRELFDVAVNDAGSNKPTEALSALTQRAVEKRLISIPEALSSTNNKLHFAYATALVPHINTENILDIDVQGLNHMMMHQLFAGCTELVAAWNKKCDELRSWAGTNGRKDIIAHLATAEAPSKTSAPRPR